MVDHHEDAKNYPLSGAKLHQTLHNNMKLQLFFKIAVV